MVKNPTMGISVRVDPKVHRELTKVAGRERKSVAEMVRVAIDSFLEQHKKAA